MTSEGNVGIPGSAPPEGPAAVSVVVPAGGADPELGRCLASLARLQPPPREVLVVSDGPSEAVLRAAASHGFRAMELPVRRGPAAARNAGAAAARGSILLFLDADVEAPADLVARVAGRFRRRPEVAALFGSYDAEPRAPGVVSRFRNLLHHWVHQQGRCEATTFWAGCGAIRREAFEAAGGFGERFTVPSVEDIDLGHRLVEGGHRVELAKDIQVTHLKRWTLASMVRTDVLGRAAPWTRLMLARRRLDGDLNLRPAQRLSGAVSGALAAGLAAAAVSPGLWPWPAACTLGLAALNRGFYGFLARRGGIRLLAAGVPLHWLHFLCCLAGLAVGTCQHLAARRRRSPGAVEEVTET